MLNLPFLLMLLTEILYPILSCVLFVVIFRKIARRSNSLDDGFVRPRVEKSIQIIALILFLSWFLDSSAFLYSAPFFGCLGYTGLFVVRPFPGSKLCVVPNMLNKSVVQVHLTEPGQAFDRETYVELPQLVQSLRARSVKVITMSSPMFFKGTAVRSHKHLERVLRQHVSEIEHRQISMFTNPVQLMSMLFYKYVLREKTLKHSNITLWYRYTLHLK